MIYTVDNLVIIRNMNDLNYRVDFILFSVSGNILKTLSSYYKIEFIYYENYVCDNCKIEFISTKKK
jgi:hypothetical protein